MISKTRGFTKLVGPLGPGNWELLWWFLLTICMLWMYVSKWAEYGWISKTQDLATLGLTDQVGGAFDNSSRKKDAKKTRNKKLKPWRWVGNEEEMDGNRYSWNTEGIKWMDIYIYRWTWKGHRWFGFHFVAGFPATESKNSSLHPSHSWLVGGFKHDFYFP